MTIYDLIEEVKHSRNKVIPTEYILKRLTEVERHECEHCVKIQSTLWKAFLWHHRARKVVVNIDKDHKETGFDILVRLSLDLKDKMEERKSKPIDIKSKWEVISD